MVNVADDIDDRQLNEGERTQAKTSKGGQSATMILEAGKLVHEGRDMTVRSSAPAKPREQAARTPVRPIRAQTNMYAYMYPNTDSMPNTAYL
eukprot:gene5691-11480_t